MNNALNNEDIKNVRKAINNDYDSTIELLKKINSDELDAQEKTKLIDILSLDLVRNGLGTDDEPNDYGLALEHIVDKLNN
ncbi:MAG TPA: hypothetical protein VF597_00250 [Candidatus Saccharimonadales bacterium]